jgi:hypothetical protein
MEPYCFTFGLILMLTPMRNTAVIRFEHAIAGLMEQNDDGHDLAGIHLGWAQALSLSRCQQVIVPVRGEVLPEIIHRTKEFQYTHVWNLLGIDVGVILCSIIPGGIPYPELTLT